MKIWRVIVTDADGVGGGQEFQDRWAAEEAYQAARQNGRTVIMAEFIRDAMTDVVHDSRLERAIGNIQKEKAK